MYIYSQARINGFVSTISGRRRYLESISSSESAQRAASERQAVNSVIQGSASDVIKLAMILLNHHIDSDAVSTSETSESSSMSKTKLLMQIHDELIYEVHVPSTSTASNPVTCSAVQLFSARLKKVMEVDVARLLGLTVSIPVQINVGLDWGHMSIYV